MDTFLQTLYWVAYFKSGVRGYFGSTVQNFQFKTTLQDLFL